jgi:hypothetical protein
MAAALAAVAAGPASASRYSPSIHLLCSAAANNATLEGTLCVLPPGQTTAPNAYTATIAVSKANVGPTVTFTLTAGSLPPGLSMPSQSQSGDVITGNPTQAGTFNFTVKAADGPTATMTYQITVTVQGPPDKLLCTPAANGGFLENGVCLLPDAVTGQPYTGHLVTSHQAGGSFSIVAGSLPPGLSLPSTFGPSGAIVGGTSTAVGVAAGNGFTVRGTGDQGQPLYQAYSIAVDQDVPLSINTCCTTLGGTVGQADSKLFYLVGGAAPYTWSLASGQFPPGMTLQTFSDPRDANDELAGTPTTAGTYHFTMRLADYNGQQATLQFTFIVVPPLQITTTTLPAGTVGVPYRHDLDLIAQGGTPPYSWFVVNNISELPPGLTLDTTAPAFNNVLAGTPTQAGTFSFPMQVQDSQDNTVSATLTVTINP